MAQGLLPYVIIPLSTLLLAGREDWLATNFSLIGSQGWGRLAFLIWGVVIGLYFFRQLGILIPALGGGLHLQRLRHLSLLLFLCSLTTPYLPQSAPLRASTHVLLALMSTILLFFVVLGLLLQLRKVQGRTARPYLLAMAAIGAVVAVLLAVAGIVSTALEVFLILSNVFLLQQMEKIQPSI